MSTVRDLVSAALREINVLASGEAAEAADASDGLGTLNRLMDQWAAERLMIYQDTRYYFTINPGQQDYDLGGTETTQLLTNPSFEGNFTAGLPEGWTKAGVVVPTDETGTVHDGLHSLKLTGAGATSVSHIYQIVHALPRAQITISAWAFTHNLTMGLAVFNRQTSRYYTNNAGIGTWLTCGDVTSLSGPLPFTGPSIADVWQQLSGTLTIQDNNYNPLKIILWNNDAAGTYGFWDQIKVTTTLELPRPSRLDYVSVIDTTVTPNYERPLFGHTFGSWNALSVKSISSLVPTTYYYNPRFPSGRVSLWPVPTTLGLVGVMAGRFLLQKFQSLDTVVELPPGYERMIVKNLAIELAPGYSRQIDPLLLDQAREARAIVKNSNSQQEAMQFEKAALIGNQPGAFNIYSGQ